MNNMDNYIDPFYIFPHALKSSFFAEAISGTLIRVDHQNLKRIIRVTGKQNTCNYSDCIVMKKISEGLLYQRKGSWTQVTVQLMDR